MKECYYIDGSCQGNGLPEARAGYAVVSQTGEVLVSGRVPGAQTNNRAEIMAVISALSYLKENALEATLLTDSKLVYDSLSGTSKRRANKDLWEQVEAIAPQLSGQWEIRLIPRGENNADHAAKVAARKLF